MALIQQVYCTHCTYGSSALEQREGEIANRVLGYSARAASLDGAQLRHDFREIERFLYYYLPSDTPHDEKQRLTAATAPRRLFFYPSSGTLQIVGQACYRQYDTAGRVGSYFAHVLFAAHRRAPQGGRPTAGPSASRSGSSPGGSRSGITAVAPAPPANGQPEADVPGAALWPAAECLRLWGAPWVEEDSESHSKKIAELGSLSELWGTASPVIDDDLLLRFLTARRGEPIDTSASVVSPRWSDIEPNKRRELLVNTLQGFLSLGPQSRDNVVLVAEPGVAALIFYGVARLLPQSVSAGLSFSTFEPNVERAAAGLVATSFHSPENDLKPEFYRRRGFAMNTFTGRTCDAGPPRGEFAAFIVDRLLADGWKAADRLVASFHDAGAKSGDDLELLRKSVGVVNQLLSAASSTDDSWRASTAATRYVCDNVRRRLSGVGPGAGVLEQIVGSDHHLQVLELVATEPNEKLLPAAKFLLGNYPDAELRGVLLSSKIGRPFKVDTLTTRLEKAGRLPPGCDALLLPSRSATQTAADETLLADVLARLSEEALRRWFDSLEPSARPQLLPCLFTACLKKPPTALVLKRLIVSTLLSLPGPSFLTALLTYQGPLDKCLPRPTVDRETQTMIAELAKPLDLLVQELPSHPQQFSGLLDLLVKCFENGRSGFFSDPDTVQKRLANWNAVRKQLLALRDQAPKGARGWVASLMHHDGKPAAPGTAEKALVKAMLAAMPSPRQFNDPAGYADETGEKKVRALRGIAQALLGKSYSDALDWKTVDRYLMHPKDMNERPISSALRGQKPSKGSKQKPPGGGKFSMFLICGLVIGSLVVLFAIYGFLSKPRASQVAGTPTAKGKSSAHDAKGRSSVMTGNDRPADAPVLADNKRETAPSRPPAGHKPAAADAASTAEPEEPGQSETKRPTKPTDGAGEPGQDGADAKGGAAPAAIGVAQPQIETQPPLRPRDKEETKTDGDHNGTRPESKGTSEGDGSKATEGAGAPASPSGTPAPPQGADPTKKAVSKIFTIREPQKFVQPGVLRLSLSGVPMAFRKQRVVLGEGRIAFDDGVIGFDGRRSAEPCELQQLPEKYKDSAAKLVLLGDAAQPELQLVGPQPPQRDSPEQQFLNECSKPLTSLSNLRTNGRLPKNIASAPAPVQQSIRTIQDELRKLCGKLSPPQGKEAQDDYRAYLDWLIDSGNKKKNEIQFQKKQSKQFKDLCGDIVTADVSVIIYRVDEDGKPVKYVLMGDYAKGEAATDDAPGGGDAARKDFGLDGDDL